MCSRKSTMLMVWKVVRQMVVISARPMKYFSERKGTWRRRKYRW